MSFWSRFDGGWFHRRDRIDAAFRGGPKKRPGAVAACYGEEIGISANDGLGHFPSAREARHSPEAQGRAETPALSASRFEVTARAAHRAADPGGAQADLQEGQRAHQLT